MKEDIYAMGKLLEAFSLTEEQREAVDIDKNIALSAGAGSGKTRVLTYRYLKLLESGVDIDSIVALTFTEKAALEMKERVMVAILDMIRRDRANRHLWQNNLDRLNRANISTIHSFCTNILRENAAFIGIDYNFTIIDELESQLILDNIWETIISSISRDNEFQDFIQFMSTQMGKEYTTDMLKSDILRIRTSILSRGWNLRELGENECKDTLSGLVMKLISYIDSAYFEYKMEKDMLDYDDLQTLCYEVLCIDKINRIYKDRYTYFMIDEFQDTNQIQKDIIYSLVEDDTGDIPQGTLFVVGDFKQSIYGFRGTDYRIFQEVQDDLGSQCIRSLKTSFRSKREIIYGINNIFFPLIDSYEDMLPFKEDEDGKEKRIKLIKYSPNRSASETKNSIDQVKRYIKSKERKDIRILRDKLFELRENISKVQPIDEGTMGEAVVRSISMLTSLGLEYSDICILVRSRSLNYEMEEKLIEYNIPYIIVGGSNLFDAKEVKDIINIYELILDGYYLLDDSYLKLIEVLKSDIFNISDDVLLLIRKNQVERNLPSFWDSIAYTIKSMRPGYDRDRLSYAYFAIEKLSKDCSNLNVVDALTYIVQKCELIERLICHRQGIQKIRNVEKLLNMAEELDDKMLFYGNEFIEYFRMLEEHSREEEGILDAQDSQAIRIMTIHQAKGLEFGGVIIPGIEKDLLYMSNREISNMGVTFDNDNLLFRGYNGQGEKDTFTCYAEDQSLEEIEEGIRLLYVAMTRAKDYVVLVGKEDKKDSNMLNSFYNMLLYAINSNEEAEKWIETIWLDDMDPIKRGKEN